MAGGQQASKGNPASKRMMNKRREERRKASWARGQKRNVAKNAANEARAKANLEELRALGGEQRPYERVVERLVPVLVKGQRVTELKTLKRVKLESPGTALARVRREQRAVKTTAV